MNAALAKFLAPYGEPDSAAAVLVADDIAALRVAVAWPAISKTWTRPNGSPPRGERERWLWLWTGVRYDQGELANATALPVGAVLKKMSVLMLSRLVRPDGTTSELALLVARRRAAGDLK